MVSFRSIAILLIAFAPMANGKPPVVLDLGRLQIEGEVRRPFIKVLDTSESIKKIVKTMKINELRRFETQMLKPSPLPPQERKDKQQ